MILLNICHSLWLLMLNILNFMAHWLCSLKSWWPQFFILYSTEMNSPNSKELFIHNAWQKGKFPPRRITLPNTAVIFLLGTSPSSQLLIQSGEKSILSLQADYYCWLCGLLSFHAAFAWPKVTQLYIPSDIWFTFLFPICPSHLLKTLRALIVWGWSIPNASL